MTDLILMTSLRFAVLAVPLLISLQAMHRAFDAPGGRAPIHVVCSGFALLSAALLVPWALYLTPLSIPSIIMGFATVVLWSVLHRFGRRHRNSRHRRYHGMI